MFCCVIEMPFVKLSRVLTAESGSATGKAGLCSYDGQ